MLVNHFTDRVYGCDKCGTIICFGDVFRMDVKERDSLGRCPYCKTKLRMVTTSDELVLSEAYKKCLKQK